MPRQFVPLSRWRDRRHRRGLLAELEAAAFLTSCGWSVEAHRFRLGHSDIDLVVRRREMVAFVEVKERRGRAFGGAVEAVGWRKRLRIGRVATAWMDRYGRRGDTYRFDLVAVEMAPEQDGRSAPGLEPKMGSGSDMPPGPARGRWRRRIVHVQDAWRMDASPTGAVRR